MISVSPLSFGSYNTRSLEYENYIQDCYMPNIITILIEQDLYLNNVQQLEWHFPSKISASEVEKEQRNTMLQLRGHKKKLLAI